MEEDAEGFLYPIVNVEDCSNCHLCEIVCPVLNKSKARLPFLVKAAYNKNEDILSQSSSGGVFTIFAEKIIELGGVVFGAAFDDNWNIHHIYVETKEALSAIRGSKYVQSNIKNSYRQAESFLKERRYVLFSGCPCQIAGLKKFLRKDYDNLICIDIICHGVPSPGIWNEYKKQIPTKLVSENQTVLSSIKSYPVVIKSINFRDKTQGWKEYCFSAIGEVAQKGVDNNSQPQYYHINEYHHNNIFMRGFLHNLYLRPSCYQCPTRKGRSDSDIQLCDFWGVNRRYPCFANQQGVSLILIYSEKGIRLYKEIEAETHHITATYDDVLDCNINVEQDEKEPRERAEFFDSFYKQGIIAIDIYCKKIDGNRLYRLVRHVWLIIVKSINRVL